jgi:hypothetical protein
MKLKEKGFGWRCIGKRWVKINSRSGGESPKFMPEASNFFQRSKKKKGLGGDTSEPVGQNSPCATKANTFYF